MKPTVILIYLFLLSCAAYGQSLNKEDEPVNRWQLTTSIGFGLDDETVNQFQRAQTQYFQSTLHYRIRKWLDLGIHLGSNNLSGAATRSIQSAVNSVGFPTSYRSLEHNWLVGVQPRFNYRVGQGDLSLAPTIGLVHHTHRNLITSPDLDDLVEVKYAPLLNTYLQAELSYTYWATRVAGLYVGVSYLYLGHGENRNQGVSVDGQAFYELTEVNNAGDLGAVGVAPSFQDRIRVRHQYYLNVGLVFRLF